MSDVIQDSGSSLTFGLGLGVMGILFLYAGMKNLTLKDAVQGNTGNAKESSAGKLAGLAFGDSTSSNAKASDSPSGKLPSGASIPKAPWNPLHKPVANWITKELNAAWNQGARFTVTSGVRSRAEQTRIYNSGVRPAAKPGTSNHEQTEYPGGAVDVTPGALSLDRVLKNMNSPLVYAGVRDPVHFSHPHNGSY